MNKIWSAAIAALYFTVFPSVALCINIPEGYDFNSSYALTHGDYAALEKQFGDALAAYRRGEIKENVLDQIFDKLTRNSDDSSETFYDRWVAKYPNSYAAVTARGAFLRDKAWRIRGSAWAKETSSEQISGFKKTLLRSRQDLLRSITLFDKPVVSYTRLIYVAVGLGTGEEREMRDRAIRLDPLTYRTRVTYLMYVVPKWGGSIDLMDEALAESNRSGMPADMKRRMQGIYDYELGGNAENNVRVTEALSLYWKASEELPPDFYSAAKSGAVLALKVRKFDWATKFLDKVITARPKEAWAYWQRGGINEIQYKLLAKAYEDYSTAAELGDSSAEQRLGWWYYNGIYVKRDLEMAEKYWKRAAAKGEEHSIHNLQHLAAERSKGTK